MFLFKCSLECFKECCTWKDKDPECKSFSLSVLTPFKKSNQSPPPSSSILPFFLPLLWFALTFLTRLRIKQKQLRNPV